MQEGSETVGDPPTEHKALLVRSHPQFDSLTRDAVGLVADMAVGLDAHYRFFAYSHGEIGHNPGFNAPGGRLEAGTGCRRAPTGPRAPSRAMCSSFVWTAVQLANERLQAAELLPIVLEDRNEPEDEARGLEYGVHDGLYRYHSDERLKAGIGLVSKIAAKIRKTFDDKIPVVAYATVPLLTFYRDTTAASVSNQMANTFALDAPELLDTTWRTPSPGETASPDNTLLFWDLKPTFGRLVQPEGGVAIYGDSVPIQLSAERWTRVPLFRKQDFDLGTGEVTGVARVAGSPTPGVTLRFDFGCDVVLTDDSDVSFRLTLGKASISWRASSCCRTRCPDGLRRSARNSPWSSTCSRGRSPSSISTLSRRRISGASSTSASMPTSMTARFEAVTSTTRSSTSTGRSSCAKIWMTIPTRRRTSRTAACTSRMSGGRSPRWAAECTWRSRTSPTSSRPTGR